MFAILDRFRPLVQHVLQRYPHPRGVGVIANRLKPSAAIVVDVENQAAVVCRFVDGLVEYDEVALVHIRHQLYRVGDAAEKGPEAQRFAVYAVELLKELDQRVAEASPQLLGIIGVVRELVSVHLDVLAWEGMLNAPADDGVVWLYAFCDVHGGWSVNVYVAVGVCSFERPREQMAMMNCGARRV